MRSRGVRVQLAAAATGLAALAATQPAGSRVRGALEGNWNSATATPLERPRELRDKPVFTPEEAAAWEREAAASNSDPPDDAPRRGTGTYNTFYREFGTQVVKTRRTSIVIDPPDGRIPPLTPAAAELKRQRAERQRDPDNPEDMGLQDRCLAFETAGPPMLPYSYNSNYQIVETSDAVVIYAEMNHDARTVRMDASSHLPPVVRRWMGDSIGRWDGDTLIVDTTNFNDGGGFYGDAGGNFGWDRNLHLVERLRLLDADTLLYQFDVDDPTAFERPWKGELTMVRSQGKIYEYACHEGNYSLANILRAKK
jgi:hypothetical protein